VQTPIKFRREVRLPADAETAFRWHERSGAIDRLIPPWEKVFIEQHSDGIDDGARVVLRMQQGPISIRWVAEHCDYDAPRQFRDVQIRGPFAQWEHTHRFIPNANGRCSLVDEIEYQLPGGRIGSLFGKRFAARKIAKMFDYRHNVTVADLEAHERHKDRGTMHVAITGSHGLVGSSLVPFLTTGGHQLTRIVRSEAGENAVRWDPSSGELDPQALDGVDAVVHLAGENIAGGRWTTAQKRRILDSRVKGTQTLCNALAQMTQPPKVLVSASAIGIYGDRGDETLDESSTPGDGFLVKVAREWETATQVATDAGIRVVHVRFGIILSPEGGALAKMLTPFKLGFGGVVGDGKQYWSWISIDDAIGAIHHAMMTDALFGPVNVVAPNPVTNHEFTKTLGRVLGRPTILPMPAAAAKLALGEMADELLLASARVVPNRLTETNYPFRHTDLEAALRHLLGRHSRLL